jgi:hypothetical protein
LGVTEWPSGRSGKSGIRQGTKGQGLGEIGNPDPIWQFGPGEIRGGGRAADERIVGKIRNLGFSWCHGTKGKLGWENKSPAGTYGMENVRAGLTL